jgi:hypothetical protein
MKTLSLNIIGLGGLFSLLVSSAFAVSSTPVGYVTLTINGGGYTALSNPLEQAVVHTGTASAINGEVITTSFSTTADSLSATDAQGNSSHYVQTASGLILDITSNTDSTITVASGASNITNGDAISVKKYSTIGDLLGTDNSIGLTSGANVTASDVVYIMSADGAGNYGTYYYQTDPFGGFFGGNGWRTPASNSLDVSNVIIAPDDGVIVSRSSPGDLSVVVTGTVNANDHSRSLPAGFSLVAYPFPVDTTLDNSGIYSASNGYVSGANIAASDVVYVIDAAGSFSLYYRQTDPFGGFFGGDGWRTPASNSVDVGANTIPAGSSIIIKHTGSGLNWASTTPYTL